MIAVSVRVAAGALALVLWAAWWTRRPGDVLDERLAEYERSKRSAGR